MALDSPHTGCIAVSREAKARGVKSNMLAREARKIIPEMIFVVARPDIYVVLHNRILAVSTPNSAFVSAMILSVNV